MALRDMQLAEVCRRCYTAGNSEDWAELIFRLQPLFARIAYRIVVEWGRANAQEIDDIVQDIFLKLGSNSGAALRRLPLDDEASTLAWLKTIAANAARDFCKARYAIKRGADKTVSADTHAESLVAALGAEAAIETQVLMREVDAVLPPDRRERAIFWLYYRQGFTAKEIADVPGAELTAKGVESLLHRLTLAVRHALGSTSPNRSQRLEKGESAPSAS